MGLAVAVLGLSPAAFWASTYYEISVALEVYREVNGAADEDEGPARMTRDRLAELAVRYPDGPSIKQQSGSD